MPSLENDVKEKDLERAQIQSHIDQYLSQGGIIEILSTNPGEDNKNGR